MVITLTIISTLLFVWILFGSTWLANRRDHNISAELRALLQARGEGSLNEEEFQPRQAALHAALLAPKPALPYKNKALGLLVALIVSTVAIYAWQSKPQTPVFKSAGPMDTHIGAPAGPKQDNVGGDLNVMVKRLADKMAKNPSNGEGWLLLARTYTEINQMKEAAGAYAKAAALLPPSANLLADWANVHVVANGGKWDAEAKQLVTRALAAEPKHVKALSLAGSEAYSRADYKTAISYWKKMQAAAEAGSMEAKLAAENIQAAEGLLTGKPSAQPATQSAAAISGTVLLDAKLKGKVSPSDTLFIVARAPDGSNPPLAVKRFTVADLPVNFKLDDSAAMLPNRTLSQFASVTMIARISKSGQATPAPGDIESKPVTAKLGASNVQLNLSSVH